MNNIQNQKIDVIYTHFPHYREPVFSELLRSDKFRFRFFFPRRGVNSTIKSGDHDFPATKMNVYQIAGLIFQPRSVIHAIRTDAQAVILLGNPNIITNWFCAAVFRLRGRKVFFWTHGWLRSDRNIKGTLRDAFYRLSNGLLLYGERARNIGLERGFKREFLHVIFNSLDVEKQRKARSEAGGLPDDLREMDPYFLSIGRLVTSLRLDDAIRSFASARSAGLRCRLIIVGDGPERASLSDLAADLGVPVIFLGAIYDETRLAELLKNCVAVISPGKVGLLALHAAVYGAPVITHNDFGSQMPEVELLEKLSLGVFFPKDSVPGLAARMVECSNDPQRSTNFTKVDELFDSCYSSSAQRRLIEQALEATGGC